MRVWKKPVCLLSTQSALSHPSDKNHVLGRNVPSNFIGSSIHQDDKHSGWTQHLMLICAKLFVALTRSTQWLSQLRSWYFIFKPIICTIKDSCDRGSVPKDISASSCFLRDMCALFSISGWCSWQVSWIGIYSTALSFSLQLKLSFCSSSLVSRFKNILP